MKMKIKTLSFIAASALLALATSCSNEDVIQSAGNAENKTVGNKEDANLTTFVSGVGTRTSMDSNNGHFFWEKNDRIYVKDDDGEFKRSTNAVTESKQAAFMFKMPGVYKASDKYMVYYPGEDGINDQVTIDNGQHQKLPNNNSHFGTSGDCGMAYGIKSPKNQFDFELVHKAAYLCFEPFTSHELVSTYVSRIEVTSDNEIAGKYTLTLHNSGETKLERAAGNHYNSITLKLGADDNHFVGFELTKDKSWKAYMVIYPGTHKLTIKYHVIDTQTGVQGDITKTLKSRDYDENNYYYIKSTLDVQKVDKKVYLWDAKEDCWYGYADEQPALPSDKGTHYPTASDQLRWHSMANANLEGTNGGSPAVNEPTKSCPNVNEILWYCFYSDPHWDEEKLWTTLKHLYKGGAWLLKKEYIKGFSSTSFKKKEESESKRYDYRKADKDHQALFGSTWKTNNQIKSITQDPISKQDKKKYFFLPAFEGVCGTNGGVGNEIGKIRGGAGYGMGNQGMYWTSTSYNLYHASYGAFQFGIKASHFGVYRSLRQWALKCIPFE